MRIVINKSDDGGVRMLIAVSATGQTTESQVDQRFGRCANFILFDTDTDEFEVLPNSANQAGSGAGIQVVQMLSQRGVQAVIAGNVGPNAVRALQASDIEIYAAGAGKTVAQAIKDWREGTLKAVQSATVRGHAGLGGGKRSSGRTGGDRIGDSAQRSGRRRGGGEKGRRGDKGGSEKPPTMY